MNELTPNELKELAEILWPDEKWILCPDGRVVADGVCRVCEPHKPTERGKAQLCDVIFALWDYCDWKSFKVEDVYSTKPFEFVCYEANAIEPLAYDSEKTFSGVGKTKADAILRLAHNVLIKKGE